MWIGKIAFAATAGAAQWCHDDKCQCRAVSLWVGFMTVVVYGNRFVCFDVGFDGEHIYMPNNNNRFECAT